MCKKPERNNLSDSIRVNLNTTCSLVQRGSIFWMDDRSPVGRHLYMIVSTDYNDRNARIMCVTLDSKPYYDRMIPIVVNDEIGFINPSILYNYSVRSFKKENLAGLLTDPDVWDFVDSYMGLTIGINKMSVKEIEELDSRLYRHSNRIFTEFFGSTDNAVVGEPEKKKDVVEEPKQEETTEPVAAEDKEKKPTIKPHKHYVRVGDIPAETVEMVRELRKKGTSIVKISEKTGVSTYGVMKILDNSTRTRSVWRLDSDGNPIQPQS